MDKEAFFFQGFQKIEVSGVGVYLIFNVSLQNKEKDIRSTLKILDTPFTY